MQAEREDDEEMGAAMKEILVRGCCGAGETPAVVDEGQGEASGCSV